MSSPDRQPTELICTECSTPLRRRAPNELSCAGDGTVYSRRDGIWRFLSPQQEAGFEPFVSDYHRLRRREGWGSEDRGYYRALPYRDTSGRHPEVWRIRAASFDVLLETVLEGSDSLERRLKIADLGAGNCWLSWRLAEASHVVTAVDLSVDPKDGLAAAHAYGDRVGFDRVQASFDSVPLANESLDLAIFNGSLHYSSDLARTLGEAQRLLRPGGSVVIMDSPVYRRTASGERMVRERKEAWRGLYGEDFGAGPAAGYLTRRGLHQLGAKLGWHWRPHPLPLGWRWHLGPLVEVLRGRREPARFPLIVGRREGPS